MLYLLLLAVIVVLIIVIINLTKKSTTQTTDNIGRALPGTNTVVISVSLDSNGIPQQNFSEIELHPGQNAIFAGPSEFSIIFKNRKTPNKKVDNHSEKGVVNIEIPHDVYQQEEFVEEYRKNHFLRFDYAIRANGKELDPPLIVGRQH